MIHGELDTLAPVEQAVAMYDGFPNPEKRLLTIPGAGHNDLLYRGLNEYFAAIKEFRLVVITLPDEIGKPCPNCPES